MRFIFRILGIIFWTIAILSISMDLVGWMGVGQFNPFYPNNSNTEYQIRNIINKNQYTINTPKDMTDPNQFQPYVTERMDFENLSHIKEINMTNYLNANMENKVIHTIDQIMDRPADFSKLSSASSLNSPLSYNSIKGISGFDYLNKESKNNQIIESSYFDRFNQATYQDLFNLFDQNQCPLYIVGGLVRDVVDGNDFNGSFADIDTKTRCSPEKIENILRSNRIKFKSNRSKKLYNINRGKEAVLQLSFTKDDNIYADFTVNSIVYDPINKTFLEQDENCITDLINRELKIPNIYNSLDEWYYFEGMTPPINKLIRYIRFRTLGYSADEELHDFMVEKMNEEFSKNERKALVAFRYQIHKWRYGNEENYKEFFNKMSNFIDKEMSYCKYCKMIADIGKEFD